MAERNPYLKDSLRIEGNEIKWGREDCTNCNGRGWGFYHAREGDLDVFDICCCDCSPVFTEEDLDRLNERLFMIAHFYEAEEDPDEEQDPEDLEFN